MKLLRGRCWTQRPMQCWLWPMERENPIVCRCLPARDGRTVYLHCARVGEKLSLLKHNPKVALTAVSYYKAVSAEYTMSYASAVLRGQASIVEDDAERIRALRCISEKYSGADMDKFDAMVEKYAKAAHVIRIDVEQITGKETRNG